MFSKLIFLVSNAFAQSEASSDLQFLSEAHTAEQSVPDILFVLTLVIAGLIILNAVANLFFPTSKKSFLESSFLRPRRYSIDNLYLPCDLNINGANVSGYLRKLAEDEAEIMTKNKTEKGSSIVLDLAHLSGIQGDEITNPNGIIENLTTIGDSDWYSVTIRFSPINKQAIRDTVRQLWPRQQSRSNLVS